MPTTTPLGFEYPLDADAPNGPAEMKQIVEKAEELIQKGGVAAHFESHGVALTRTSTSIGSFSTPIAVTLPKVKQGQIIEVVGYGYFKDSIASPTSGASGGRLAYNLGGSTFSEQGLGTIRGSELLAESFARIHAAAAGWAFGQTATPLTTLGSVIPSPAVGGAPFQFVVGADATNFVVEIQGASKGSGTITAEDVYLVARVFG